MYANALYACRVLTNTYTNAYSLNTSTSPSHSTPYFEVVARTPTPPHPQHLTPCISHQHSLHGIPL
jgi:hypothetical protein